MTVRVCRSGRLRGNADQLAVPGEQTAPQTATQRQAAPYEVRFGMPVFQYFAEQPECAASFAGIMGFMSRLVEDFVFTQHQFTPIQMEVDIGGNHGGLLLKLLEHHPGTPARALQ